MRFGGVLALVATLATTSACVREAAVNRRPNTGTGTASEVGGVQQIDIRAGLDLRFHPSTIVVHPGKVRLVLINTANPGAGPPHDVQFSGLPGDDVPLTQAGQTQSVTFMAPAPGTYNFVCSIHVAQGQTGKLIVR